MKLDFLGRGGGEAPRQPERSAPTRREPVADQPNLLDRFMTERVRAEPLDDARPTIRFGLIAAGVFLAILGLFALVAPISGAAVASGEVVVAGNRFLVQPATTGIITDYLVREGQAVRAGQPLVRLNGVRSGAQLRQAQAQRDTLRAAEARLIAERDNLPRLMFPADLATRASDPTAFAAMRAQIALFQRRRATLSAETGIADAQLRAARAERIGTERQLALINDELVGIRGLYAKGFATKSRLRALERASAQLETQGATGDEQVIQASLTSARTRDNQVVATVDQLRQVQERLAQVGPQLDVSRYTADRDLIRAPAAGRVGSVASVGPGTVVSAGQTLMELVPDARALVVEARVKPSDIDDVAVGSTATVRFTSVNPRGRSAFDGRVTDLSPAPVADPAGGPSYYRARIAIDGALAAREGVTLQPGVPATVNIETRARNLFDYLVAPLGDAISGGFREE